MLGCKVMLVFVPVVNDISRPQSRLWKPLEPFQHKFNPPSIFKVSSLLIWWSRNQRSKASALPHFQGLWTLTLSHAIWSVAFISLYVSLLKLLITYLVYWFRRGNTSYFSKYRIYVWNVSMVTPDIVYIIGFTIRVQIANTIVTFNFW